MEIDAQVESKPLNDREGARMQRSNRTQSVLLFDPASEVLVEPPEGGLQHASKQRVVVGQADRQWPGEGAGEMPVAHRRKQMVDEEDRCLAYPSSHARWTETSALA
jgi:hypothetical protein